MDNLRELILNKKFNCEWPLVIFLICFPPPQWTLLWFAFCFCVWCRNHPSSCTSEPLPRCFSLYCHWDLSSTTIHSLPQSSYWKGTALRLLLFFHNIFVSVINCINLQTDLNRKCFSFIFLTVKEFILAGPDVWKITLSYWRTDFQVTPWYLPVPWSVSKKFH